MIRVKQKKKVIRLPEVPGPGVEPTGETVMWGKERKHVYRELRPVAHISHLVHVTDEDGKKVWKDGRDGRRGLPHRERRWDHPADPDAPQVYGGAGPDVEDERNWREFIYDDIGNGNDTKIFGFREDPEVEARKRADAEREQAWERVRKELDPSELLAAMKRMQGEPSGLEVEQADNGYWTIKDGEEVIRKGRGQENLDAALAELQGEPQAA